MEQDGIRAGLKTSTVKEQVAPKPEPRYVNLVGTVLAMQRLENGGIDCRILIQPRPYPPKNDSESDENYRLRCKPVLDQVNAYNMLVWSGLRFDDVVLAQEVLL